MRLVQLTTLSPFGGAEVPVLVNPDNVRTVMVNYDPQASKIKTHVRFLSELYALEVLESIDEVRSILEG